MKTKRRNSFFVMVALATSSLCANKVVAQENMENPMDTLARNVQNLNDQLSVIKRLKFTGYVQPQFQHIDSAGAPSFAAGDFKNGDKNYHSRFTMRRGRIKFTYTYKNTEYMLNTDFTEKGVAIRETYAKLTDPWTKSLSLTAGLLQVQFGYELTYSSSHRETPERARYNQILFSTERDLGAFITYQAPKTSALKGVKVDLAVMNGAAGVSPEFDSNKDLTARLQYSKTSRNERATFALGGSYYYGGYRIYKETYRFKDSEGVKCFEKITDEKHILAKRDYKGIDAQVTFDWPLGMTTLRGEYIQGKQPGSDSTNSKSLTSPLSGNKAMYERLFNGAYFYFIQNIGQSPLQLVLKYDFYDPNTQIAGKDIGLKFKEKNRYGAGVGDIRFDTYGVGLTYRFNAYAKLVTYYDIVKNEETSIKPNVAKGTGGYLKDIKDNVLTVRMQFRF